MPRRDSLSLFVSTLDDIAQSNIPHGKHSAMAQLSSSPPKSSALPPIDTSAFSPSAWSNGTAHGPSVFPGPIYSSPSHSTHDSPASRMSLEANPSALAPRSSGDSGPQLHHNSTNRRSSANIPSQLSSSLPAQSDSPLKPNTPRLQHRHTLEVPRVSTNSRLSTELASPQSAHPDQPPNGRPPTAERKHRRASQSIGRRLTRSIHSDMPLEDNSLTEDDANKFSEAIRQKRAQRRRRKEEEDDDRVVVGTKVDQNHVNWVTAYNMLTGIRFTVSRTNAKIDRELTSADFEARHKFSFDITGNEITPGAKYDFKFKDYAPWVFRHLRQLFNIDPADYLISLTSKYILSELGSPGKSGSFFYFSRDYKYIIKTIHHSEHVLLRRILRKYYDHINNNRNTLLSQFYGLHRVKMPYGKKIHFVVMNNLFPPHRDIHQTFDLKGSMVGRDYREDDIERHPRATLKDLNWLRRQNHLELGPEKKTVFVEQLNRDVALLEELKIMDYSLLIGIHDLERGNDENLRDKTLRVFEANGEAAEDNRALPAPPAPPLQRSPSKLENARKAKELRQKIKSQRPVPMGTSENRMPSEMPSELVAARSRFYFYSDDGGFRATHQDDRPGERIYYLGIIDCLTKYNAVKKSEHFFKGLLNHAQRNEISAVPPVRYGERFVEFIRQQTMPRELGAPEKMSMSSQPEPADVTRSTVDSSSVEGGTTLPVVEEVGEGHNTAEQSNVTGHAADQQEGAGRQEEDEQKARQTQSMEREGVHQRDMAES